MGEKEKEELGEKEKEEWWRRMGIGNLTDDKEKRVPILAPGTPPPPQTSDTQRRRLRRIYQRGPSSTVVTCVRLTSCRGLKGGGGEEAEEEGGGARYADHETNRVGDMVEEEEDMVEEGRVREGGHG